MVGSAVAEVARSRKHEVATTYHRRKPIVEGECYKLDIVNQSQTHRAIRAARPEWVVLTSAMASVDQCENDSRRAWLTNALGPGNIARACEAEGVKLMLISTDYVFSGEKKHPYVESDLPSPINVYAHTKLVGEKMVTGICKNSTVVRTSVVYDWLPKRKDEGDLSTNFGMWVIKKLEAGEEIRATDRQLNTPTFNENLAEALISLLEESRFGLFHISGKTCASRFAFANMIARAFEFDGKLIKLGDISVVGRAPRPRYTCLDVRKAESVGIRLQTLEEGISMMREKAGRI